MPDNNGIDVATETSDLGQSFADCAVGREAAPEPVEPTPALETDAARVDSGSQSLARSFNEGAQEPEPFSTLDTSVTATASAEIQVIEDAERALAQHDDRWRELSDRLSNRPVAAPALDMDGGAQRSVAREYTAYRREWGEQRDAIEYGAIQEAIDVRANGTTLSNEFTATSQTEHAAPEVAPEPAAPTREPATESQFQREFSVAAPGPSHTIDR